ncbi:PLP-dependent aminotransferase family protein [Bacillus sp. AGMB 02131]|uniref:PLP-dependent aminotransferase family protein n=1 Tax=Peribacillus faecalis TaxID=2772559 RepID=A0A927CW06_9BACI|nr:PLP-dependent aminotransferase family protein [Peribacillus faecalis]MBD3106990.1 PLP-dependent aminotransferase family protein [Peribacillus faecalis]
MKQFIFPLHKEAPKYKQIYENIRLLIEKGQLKSDEQLPSIRQLAETLKVSRNTTLIAYEQLIAEGYIRSELKKGYFVEKYEPIFIQVKQSLNRAENTEGDQYIIDFRAGAVDQASFPLKKWRKCANEVLHEQQSYIYGNRQGEECLRKQISNYLFQSRGIDTTAESIVIGSSTQQMLMHISLLLRKRFSSIILENPGYRGARSVFECIGYNVEAIDIGAKGINMDQLEKMQSKLIYVTPSHQYPTGTTIPIQERQQLLQWAMSNGGYIFEDDYDSEFRYKQQPIPALASLNQDCVIYVSNFSKAFLPSLRLSYMVLPENLLEEYQKMFAAFEQAASSLHQRAMARFMEKGYWESHIRKMRAVYKQKMQELVNALERRFGDAIEVIGQHSGLYILVRIQTLYSEEDLIGKAKRHGVKVYPTSMYYITGQPDTAMLKLGFTNCSIEEIRQGVELLYEAWK